MNVQTRISRARAGLILSNPFYGTLAMGMGCEIVGDEITETMATDGKALYVNPAWVDTQGDPELRFTVAHEALHVALGHHTRRGTRDPKLWNVATDHVINLALIAEGFKAPEGILADPRFAGMSAEQVYAALAKEGGGKPQPQQGQSKSGAGGGAPGQIGDVLDAADPADQAAMRAAELERQVKAVQAATAAKAAGKASVAGSEIMADIRAAKVNWRDALQRFADDAIRSDYAWHAPDRRFLSREIYIPGMVHDGMGRLVVIMDQSGSVNADAHGAFTGELITAIDTVQPAAVDVIYCDTKVMRHDSFEDGEPVTIANMRGGGTNMQPAFDLAATLDPKAVICFTDLEFHRPVKDPGAPTLWAHWGGSGITPTFGEVITVD